MTYQRNYRGNYRGQQGQQSGQQQDQPREFIPRSSFNVNENGTAYFRGTFKQGGKQGVNLRVHPVRVLSRSGEKNVRIDLWNIAQRAFQSFIPIQNLSLEVGQDGKTPTGKLLVNVGTLELWAYEMADLKGLSDYLGELENMELQPAQGAGGDDQSTPEVAESDEKPDCYGKSFDPADASCQGCQAGETCASTTLSSKRKPVKK